MSGPGSFMWNELSSTDLEASKKFLGEVVGWSFDEVDMGSGTYTIAKSGDSQVAGLMSTMDPNMPSAWVSYVHVADVDAAAAKVEGAGGKVMVPMMDVPNVGRFCWVQDPAGAVFALMTPAESMNG
ncbi:MAG: VOC family protein [Pseudomonadota bacterium]